MAKIQSRDVNGLILLFSFVGNSVSLRLMILIYLPYLHQ